jgi:hypothetical protein
MKLPKEMKFDGIYFLPHEDEEGNEGLKFQLFELKDEDRGTPENGSQMGDAYHLIFFKEGEDGYPELEDNFEAILVDPWTYAQNLVGAKVYGCILRRTDKSPNWVDDYLKRVGQHSIMKKLKQYAESISEI